MNTFLQRLGLSSMNEDRLFKRIVPDLYDFILKRDGSEIAEYSLSEFIQEFNDSINISKYLSKSDIEYLKSQNKLNLFIPELLQRIKYKKIILNELTKQIQRRYKLLWFNPQGLLTLSPKTIQFINNRFYPYMREAVRSIIAELDNEPIKERSATNIFDEYIIPALQNTKLIRSLNMSDVEDFLFMDYVTNRYRNIILPYIHKYIRRTDKNSDILKRLHTYIMSNLRKIFLQFNIDKDGNNMYAQSWFDSFGNLINVNESNLTELNYLKKYLYNNQPMLCEMLGIKSIRPTQWKDLIYTYITAYSDELVSKIYDLLSAKNAQLKKQRATDLLNLNDDDKINVKDSTTIDYDIANDYVRSRPIIIVKDKNTHKDYVFFGPARSSHGFYIQNKLKPDCQAKHIEIDESYLGYGYLLDNIAFLDDNPNGLLTGYTNEELVSILKNDPRIKKVYTTPPPGGHGGPITRLARLIYAK